jgi:hypothetical protein
MINITIIRIYELKIWVRVGENKNYKEYYLSKPDLLHILFTKNNEMNIVLMILCWNKMC